MTEIKITKELSLSQVEVGDIILCSPNEIQAFWMIVDVSYDDDKGGWLRWISLMDRWITSQQFDDDLFSFRKNHYKIISKGEANSFYWNFWKEMFVPERPSEKHQLPILLKK